MFKTKAKMNLTVHVSQLNFQNGRPVLQSVLSPQFGTQILGDVSQRNVSLYTIGI
jgi:hypothetical protein